MGVLGCSMYCQVLVALRKPCSACRPGKSSVTCPLAATKCHRHFVWFRFALRALTLARLAKAYQACTASGSLTISAPSIATRVESAIDAVAVGHGESLSPATFAIPMPRKLAYWKMRWLTLANGSRFLRRKPPDLAATQQPRSEEREAPREVCAKGSDDTYYHDQPLHRLAGLFPRTSAHSG